MPFPLDSTAERCIEQHFKRRPFEWNESFFLSVLETSQQKYDIYWSAIALRRVGSDFSVESLRQLFAYPMRDVKCVSILTIAHIARERATQIFADALLDPSYREKGYAMWAINDAADARAVDAVLKYFHANRAKLKRGRLKNGSVPKGIEYLSRMAVLNAGARSFLQEVPSFFGALEEDARIELLKRVPNLLTPLAGA
jgi:hypothetical protein